MAWQGSKQAREREREKERKKEGRKERKQASKQASKQERKKEISTLDKVVHLALSRMHVLQGSFPFLLGFLASVSRRD